MSHRDRFHGYRFDLGSDDFFNESIICDVVYYWMVEKNVPFCSVRSPERTKKNLVRHRAIFPHSGQSRQPKALACSEEQEKRKTRSTKHVARVRSLSQATRAPWVRLTNRSRLINHCLLTETLSLTSRSDRFHGYRFDLGSDDFFNESIICDVLCYWLVEKNVPFVRMKMFEVQKEQNLGQAPCHFFPHPLPFLANVECRISDRHDI
ncbi:hypothetical protein CEXT_658021 [Caerostris extrusa]|uniref:Uncharacterized protein n=1 Tax=Caerostris extrusa TaxID=172846 RepID=A0AAV4NJL1_CAEEX|nr:hypothetical protein CEXT_658021 [Caerostris extrusa]